MAVVTCPACRAEAGESALLCSSCGAALDRRAQRPAVRRPEPTVCPECSMPNPPDTETCARCRTALRQRPIAFAIRFPWGTIPIAGRLTIGRDPGYAPQVAEHLSDMLGVSRRHAEFVHSHDRLTVTDIGSKHGTTVNRHRIAVSRPTEIAPDDTVGFSDQVTARVERWREVGS